MSAATLERVSIDLGGRRVLSDVSLSIEESEFVGLLGPNGSGKTTLMRALLGLIFAQHRHDLRAGPAGSARQSRHRLHAADAPDNRGATSQRV